MSAAAKMNMDKELIFKAIEGGGDAPFDKFDLMDRIFSDRPLAAEQLKWVDCVCPGAAEWLAARNPVSALEFAKMPGAIIAKKETFTRVFGGRVVRGKIAIAEDFPALKGSEAQRIISAALRSRTKTGWKAVTRTSLARRVGISMPTLKKWLELTPAQADAIRQPFRAESQIALRKLEKEIFN